LSVLAFVLAAALAPAAPAGNRVAAAGGSTLLVESDRVRYAFKRREVIFTGADRPVTLTREDARLTCRELVLRNDAAGKVETATCKGDVKLVRGERTLTCEKAIFEAAADRVTCEGDPLLRERGSEVRGVRLVYDLGADEARFEGTPEKPVQAVVPGDEVEERRKALEDRRREARR
jgi:lipopolysaccharide export system protein LptA